MKRGIARHVNERNPEQSMLHETPYEVMDLVQRVYDDFFPQQHPFEMTGQPAIVERFKKGICGLSTKIIGGTKNKKVAIPENSIFTKKYILDSIGI
jgi:hypothetical protein